MHNKKGQSIIDQLENSNTNQSFYDMTPDFTEARRKVRQRRAKELATKWMEAINNKLIEDKDFFERKIFKQGIRDGRRFSIGQIQRLNTIQKRDYFEEILQYDESVTNHISRTHA